MSALAIDELRQQFFGLTDSWFWEIQGFLDSNSFVPPIDSSTKVMPFAGKTIGQPRGPAIGKAPVPPGRGRQRLCTVETVRDVSTVFERMATPALRSIARDFGYRVELQIKRPTQTLLSQICAAKPIISRRKSPAVVFPNRACRSILSFVIGGLRKLSFATPTYPKFARHLPQNLHHLSRHDPLAPSQGIFVHRETRGVFHAYAALKRPIKWLAAIDFSDINIANARLAAEFDDWAPALTALISDSDTIMAQRPLHTLPIDHHWNRVPGVILLVNAAHLAPPASKGANLALLDRADLDQAIPAHPEDIETALAVALVEFFSSATGA